MAIADYYDRAALAAAQVIGGFDEAAFKKRLEGLSVGVSWGPSAVESPEGRALLNLLVRLLARLYPSISFASADQASPLTSELITLAQSINPALGTATEAVNTGIAVGSDAPAFEETLYAGSQAWDALLSWEAPQPVGDTPLPCGAGAAACLAAADLFKRLFLHDWQPRVLKSLRFSTAQRCLVDSEPDGSVEALSAIDAVLVGNGAIGNAAVWALGRASLEGVLHLVDAETIELSNLQRYVLGTRGDETASKVEVASQYFNNGVKPVTHASTWDQFVAEHGYRWDTVLVALDSAAARRQVQASLPRRVINAWTQPGDLGISVHSGFGGTGACLACLYLPANAVPNEDELVAQALKIPELVGDVRTLLYSGKQVPRSMLESIARNFDRPIDDLLPFAGGNVRDLYVEGICGGGIIPLGEAGLPEGELHVPLAHQSALAGILLAAALISEASTPPTTQVTRIDVLGPVSEFATQPLLKNEGAHCICDDSDYRSAYQEKYAAW